MQCLLDASNLSTNARPARGTARRGRHVLARLALLAVGSRLGVVSQLGHHDVDRLGASSGRPNALLLDHHPGCMSVAGHVASLASPTRPRSIDLSAFGVVRPGDSSSGEKVPSPVAGRRLAGYLAGCKIFLHCIGPTISFSGLKKNSFSARVGTCTHGQGCLLYAWKMSNSCRVYALES